MREKGSSVRTQQKSVAFLSSGQISYEAISVDEPPSKHIALARKITVKLTLLDLNTDLQVLADSGLAGLRRHRR